MLQYFYNNEYKYHVIIYYIGDKSYNTGVIRCIFGGLSHSIMGLCP